MPVLKSVAANLTIGLCALGIVWMAWMAFPPWGVFLGLFIVPIAFMYLWRAVTFKTEAEFDPAQRSGGRDRHGGGA